MTVNEARRRRPYLGALLAFVLAIAASAVFVAVARSPESLAIVFTVAGALNGLAVRDRTGGFLGLLAGVSVAFLAIGAYAVTGQARSCEPNGCTGLSSPGFTAAIVAALGVGAGVAAIIGFGIGRLIRRLIAR
jgi:hypothetical protein